MIVKCVDLVTVLIINEMCYIAGHINIVGHRRHPAVVGRPHGEGADNERFSVHQAIRSRDERMGDQAAHDAGHSRQLAQGLSDTHHRRHFRLLIKLTCAT